MLRTLTILLTLLLLPPPLEASLYERLYTGYCLPTQPSGYTSSYHHLLHHSIPNPHLCSTKCDETNGYYEPTHEFYRGFSYVKNGGDCYCYYDAGHLPPNVAYAGEDVTWEAVRRGDAQGEIGGGDGTEGVGCYSVIVRETFPIKNTSPDLFANGLRH